MLQPWTQTLTLSWGPELGFFEQRTAFLRKLRDRDDLQAFRFHEQHIDARLRASGHELSVRQDGLVLEVQGPESDLDLVERTVGLALEMFSPEVRSQSAAFQFVVELRTSFEDALSQGRAAVFRDFDWPQPEGRPSDFAVLMDLGLGAARGVIEFGVVQDSELPGRLARTVGNQTIGRGPQRREYLWRGVSFPAVALFGDAGLTEEPYDRQPDIGRLLARWDELRGMVGGVVAALHDRISQVPTKETTA